MVEISLHSCRVCLKNPINLGQNLQPQMKAIDDKDENSSFSFAEQFSMCTGIQIAPDFLYAKNICGSCLVSLRESFSFLVTSKKTEIILQNYVHEVENNKEQNKPLPKVTFDSPGLSDKALESINREIKTKIGSTSNDNITENDPNIEFLSIHKVEPYYSDNDDESDKLNDSDENILYYENVKVDKNYKKLNKVENILCIKKVKKNKNKKKISNLDNSTESSIEKNSRLRLKKPPKPKKPAKEPETPVICDICGNFYKDRKQLEYHRHLHTGEKSFKCSICDRGFALRSYLTGHMLTHTGVRKFQCNFCDKKFYRACVMRLHEKKHNLQRDFECQICNKKFKLSNYLKRHMRIHNDERPYSCKLCAVSFRRDHHLKQHIRTRAHRELMTKPKQEEFLPQVTDEHHLVSTVSSIFQNMQNNEENQY